MRALVLRNSPSSLRIDEIPIPILKSGEVLIRLRAAALNRRDHWIAIGKYAKIVYPCVLGSDGAGIVESVFDKKDRDLIGQSVVINPNINWGNDPAAQSPNFSMIGMPTQGTFAEFIAVPAQRVCALPVHLSFTQAASLPVAGVTAFRALTTQAEVSNGMSVLVSGVGGGVALFAVQFALAMGCTVYVTSTSDEKIKASMLLGASGGVNTTKTGWAQELMTLHSAIDCIIDGIGGELMNSFMQIVKPGGKIVSYGATLGAVPDFELRRIFWKQIRLIGTTMGSDNDFTNMIDFVSTHSIEPRIDSVLPLSEVSDAFKLLGQSSQFGKIVIKIS